MTERLIGTPYRRNRNTGTLTVHTVICRQEQNFRKQDLYAVDIKTFLQIALTYFIPLRCIMLKTMVAFIKKRIKKSTISAINLWAKDGITYSLPVNLKKKKKLGKLLISHRRWKPS